MSIYEHLEWVHNRWEIKQPNNFVKFIEWIRAKPLYGKLDRNKNS